ncbi:MAG: DUF983 domain-containing protein [Planctomycetes bacterium]|nr:DUF983 domain-containing protein [Planctomycetota bacterium]
MRRILMIAVCGLVVGLSGVFSQTAFGCPMCGQAVESQDEADVPAAYMYSILFMLAVPATVFTGFSLGLYRLSKQNAEAGSDPETEAARHLDSHPSPPRTPHHSDAGEFRAEQ